jgi:hypothetical protein
VESVGTMTAKEAMTLLRGLGSRYHGPLDDDHPTSPPVRDEDDR